MLILFPVDHDTYELFCRLWCREFVQTNHVVHWNAPREGIFLVATEENQWKPELIRHNAAHNQAIN